MQTKNAKATCAAILIRNQKLTLFFLFIRAGLPEISGSSWGVSIEGTYCAVVHEHMTLSEWEGCWFCF